MRKRSPSAPRPMWLSTSSSAEDFPHRGMASPRDAQLRDRSRAPRAAPAARFGARPLRRRHLRQRGGFLFLRTRVLGIPIPWHRNFEEVNLRFYVRHRAPEGWRRGVVFVREIVPRQAIATLARRLYGEPYSAFPMSHRIEEGDAQLSCRYEWQRNGRREFVAATATGAPAAVAPGSLEEFITEHYWGYTARKAHCTQYQVEHPSGRFGARPRGSSKPMLPASTARNSSHRSPGRPPPPLSRTVRPSACGAAVPSPQARCRPINSRKTNCRIPPCR